MVNIPKTYTGPGKGLNYVGKDGHAFGYSGVLLVAQPEVSMLSFQTGSEFIVGQVQYLWTSTSDDYTGDDVLVRIYINNQVTGGMLGGSSHDRGREWFALVAPPLSEIKITMENVSANTDRNGLITFTGKVHA